MKRRRNPGSVFVGTDDILESIRDATPSVGHIDMNESCEPAFRGRRVYWTGYGYIVRVNVDHVLFMEGNLWNFNHAAGVVEAMEQGVCFDVPAARIHRIRVSDVKDTERFEKNGELEYQTGMTRPWKRSEVGSYKAQLIDGNHRAAAAMILGEQYIWVYVGENYRKEVRKADWE